MMARDALAYGRHVVRDARVNLHASKPRRRLALWVDVRRGAVPCGLSPSHCEYSTSVIDRTVTPSWAVRVLILRYIASGMSSVVLMGRMISKSDVALQYGFIDLWMPAK